MIVDLNKTAKTPLYQQISDHFGELVERGLLPPGSSLPSTRELATSLGVSRNTAVLAYQELEVRGLVSSHVGRGTRVNEYLPRVSGNSATPPTRPLPVEGLYAGSWRKSFGATLDVLERLAGPVAGSDTINMASAEPDANLFPVSEFRECLYRAMVRFGSAVLTGGSPRGFEPLLDYLPIFLAQRNILCEPRQLMIVNGIQQALSLVGRLFVDPGDTVILENLSYPGALGVFRSLQAQCVGCPLDQEGIRLDVLESVLNRSRPKLLYTIPTFHNPTGTCLSSERRKQLVQLCRDKQVLIVEDDYAHELCFRGRPPLPLKAWDEASGVIYLGSFSEIMFPGIRLSFILAPQAIVDRLLLIKESTDLYTNRILQGALLEFLQRGYLSKHVKKQRLFNRKRRDALVEALPCHMPLETRWQIAEGGLFQWIDLPGQIDAVELLMRARKQGVVFAPDRMFSVDAWERGGIRLGFSGLTEAQVRRGVHLIGHTIDEF